MPRIDPVQLLKCLSVLLTPEGGMKAEEVTRLVGLMTKFSKKLVSKCIYILILKNTKTELLDTFMAEGGWTLIQTWLQDAVHTSNRHLVKEIIGLLLITPVDVERLKTNILPKLIKSLSRRDDLEDVAELSTELVKHWLVIVKGSSSSAQGQSQPEKMDLSEADSTNTNLKDESSDRISPNTFYKRDGQTGKASPKKEGADDSGKEDEDVEMKDVSKEKSKNKEEKVDKEDKVKSSSRSSRSTSSSKDKEKGRDKDRYRDKDKSKSSSSSSKSSSSKSKSSSSSSRDKDRKDKDREREKDKSRQRDKSRDKDKRDKEKDKQRSNGAIKSNSSSKESSKEKKEEKKDKDKSESNLFNLVKTPSIDKLGRIPKKSTVSVDSKPKDTMDTNDVKKKSFSVGIKKDATPEERPKTVKVFNSKMRSTGLEEEVKPAPSRVAVKKPTAPVPLPPIPLKRSSPPRDIREPSIPPEKKIKMDKVDIPDRPGAIKLIPPKPKPMLQESDLFNDALTAATSKKEPKKRRRRLSSSKDTPTSPTSPREEQPLTTTTAAPPATPVETTEVSAESALGLKNIAPINFYQDTLSEEIETTPEENKENSPEEETTNSNDDEVPSESENKENEVRSPRAVTPTEDDPEELKRIRTEGVPKGVLLYSKRKGPKKTISWKNDTDLVEIRYFELDETERVNVTKAFNDMAKMEYSNEREALQLSRKVGGEDLMSVQIVWRIPFEIDLPEPLAPPGSKSLEKDIQFAREKSVLQALYFDRRKIPDSPEEPIPENHQIVDPIIIALEDPDGQEIDLKSTPWPEPKGLPPSPEPQMPIVYPNMQPQFNPQFNNMNPQNFMAPRFSVPNGPMGPQIPNNFIPNNMMPNNNMLGIGAHNLLQPNDMMMGPMNPNMFQPGPMVDGFGPGPGPEPDYPPLFGNPNGPPAKNMNSFPPKNFRDNRSNNRGSGSFRRGRGGNNDGWVSMNGGRGNNWRRGGRGGRLCKHIQNHGYCRNGDKCAFIHP